VKRFLLDLHPDQYPLEGYRRTQLLEWVFKRGVGSFAEMDNLPKTLRDDLEQNYSLTAFQKVESFPSSDGSTKYLYTLLDGRQMEAVLMPYADRTTICVSTMVGCPAGCAFCATGKLGFGRNLTPGEVIEQILYAARDQGIVPGAIRNLVFMGMGEPLLNYDNTLEAARIMLHEDGLGMSQRRVTLSTVGLPKQIVKLAGEDVTVKLAISLHAPDEETRQRIIPTAHAHTIHDILEAAREYQRRSKRRVTFEYAMLAGVNDALWQAELLADLLKGLISHVNLIPMNAWSGSDFASSSESRIQAFYDVLEARGIPVSVRRSRGRDAGAACGQLALKRPDAVSSRFGTAV
jgi:23S rRNA (adenine2503-C2)-methyltransferase